MRQGQIDGRPGQEDLPALAVGDELLERLHDRAIVCGAELEEFVGLHVAPTSASARPASFRPTITLGGRETRVLVQTTVVDPQRGRSAGRLDASELRAVDDALSLILGL